MLLLIQVALLAMLGYDLWSRTSNGADLPMPSVLAMVGIGILTAMTLARWHREKTEGS